MCRAEEAYNTERPRRRNQKHSNKSLLVLVTGTGKGKPRETSKTIHYLSFICTSMISSVSLFLHYLNTGAPQYSVTGLNSFLTLSLCWWPNPILQLKVYAQKSKMVFPCWTSLDLRRQVSKCQLNISTWTLHAQNQIPQDFYPQQDPTCCSFLHSDHDKVIPSAAQKLCN